MMLFTSVVNRHFLINFLLPIQARLHWRGLLFRIQQRDLFCYILSSQPRRRANAGYMLSSLNDHSIKIKNPVTAIDTGFLWCRLLDSNQWPSACEDPSGRQSPAIGPFPVLLAPLFQNRQEVIIHCVCSLISGYWSAYWSNPRLRSISGAGDAFHKR